MSNPLLEPGFVPNWDIHDRVSKARRSAGLEQGELAEKAGLSRKSISRYETGLSTPRRAAIIAIAFATGVNVEWLETGKTPTTPGNDGGKRWGQRGSNPRPTDYGSTTIHQHTAGVA